MKARTTKEGCMVKVTNELASQRGQKGGRHNVGVGNETYAGIFLVGRRFFLGVRDIQSTI